mmetsp:Transcript_11525/g.18366  ORF Transcript_11525/g.18366 Transcript_11525/m.18366 type:complete len:178 (+) Transcript_11525:3-536(+)
MLAARFGRTVNLANPVRRPEIQRRMMSEGTPVKPKDYRKQGPAGVGDKPYTMRKTKQDGPPPGGFAPIKTKRFVGVTTSIPSSVFVGLTGLGMAYGMWKVGNFNIKRRGWKQEKIEARRSLVPFLQAEEDIAYASKKKKRDALEAQVMSGVEGWTVGASVYNTSKIYAPPMVNDHSL